MTIYRMYAHGNRAGFGFSTVVEHTCAQVQSIAGHSADAPGRLLSYNNAQVWYRLRLSQRTAGGDPTGATEPQDHSYTSIADANGIPEARKSRYYRVQVIE